MLQDQNANNTNGGETIAVNQHAHNRDDAAR